MTNQLLDLTKEKRTNLWYKSKASGGKNRQIQKEYNRVKREIEKKTRDSVRSFEKSLTKRGSMPMLTKNKNSNIESI